MLHTLKQRLAEREQFSRKLAEIIVELQKVSVSFRAKLVDAWKDISLLVKNLREIPVDEVNHYQILVLKNLIEDKYASEGLKFEKQDA